MTNKGFYIGNNYIKNNIALAPMAGVSDVPYRHIHLKQGIGYAVSEMVLANAQFLAQGKSIEHLNLQDYKDSLYAQLQVPRSVQILGHNPNDMADLTKVIVDNNLAEIIDINMGCPAKKVVKKAAGSSLMADPDLVREILKAVVGAAKDIPVTLKMRTGIDPEHKNVAELALMAQDLGIKAITIHGRTRDDLFRGHAEYQTIAQVKRQLDIPVIANGDIDSVEKYLHVKRQTQADAFMVGRASQGNPWLMAKLVALNEEKVYREPSSWEKLHTAVTHLLDIKNYYPEIVGVRLARKHFIWYLENIFPDIYEKKSYNNLEQERVEFLVDDLTASEQDLLQKYLLPTPAQEFEQKEIIANWRKEFIQLNSYEQQQRFLESCLEIK